jgi:hypothetical protein
MSKEPTKRETEQPETEQEGWKHGYSPAQIKLMEEARNPAPAVPSKASEAVQPEAKEEEKRDKKHQ